MKNSIDKQKYSVFEKIKQFNEIGQEYLVGAQFVCRN